PILLCGRSIEPPNPPRGLRRYRADMPDPVRKRGRSTSSADGGGCPTDAGDSPPSPTRLVASPSVDHELSIERSTSGGGSSTPPLPHGARCPARGPCRRAVGSG